MKITTLSILYLCVAQAFAQNVQPQPEARLTIPLKPQAQEITDFKNADRSTPLKAAKLFLEALKVDAKGEKAPYMDLAATSPFVSEVKKRAILSRLEAIRDYVVSADKSRPAFIAEDSIMEDGDLAVAFILIPDRNNPFVCAASSLAMVKREGQWQVSLTPGSFENTFLPFDDQVRIKAAEMSVAAKKNILNLSNRQSSVATRKAIEFIKTYRQENVKGKSDDEMLKLLALNVKNADPAVVASLVVPAYYQEKIPTQRVRITPVVRGLRLQDMKNGNRFIQPTYLSFMRFPGTILVPLSAHEDDYLPTDVRPDNNGQIPQQQQKAKQNAKADKKLRSLAAITLTPPRMNLPATQKPYIIYRYAIELGTDPTDDLPVFKLNLTNAIPSWTFHDDVNTLKRVLAEFRKTYPAIAYPTRDEALNAAIKATVSQDSLTLMRMLSPENFVNLERFEQAMAQLKYAPLSAVMRFINNHQNDEPTEATVELTAIKSPDGQDITKATVGLQDHRKQAAHFQFNLYFVKKEGGWMLAGADSKELKMIEDAKKAEENKQNDGKNNEPAVEPAPQIITDPAVREEQIKAQKAERAKYEAGMGKKPAPNNAPAPSATQP